MLLGSGIDLRKGAIAAIAQTGKEVLCYREIPGEGVSVKTRVAIDDWMMTRAEMILTEDATRRFWWKGWINKQPAGGVVIKVSRTLRTVGRTHPQRDGE